MGTDACDSLPRTANDTPSRAAIVNAYAILPKLACEIGVNRVHPVFRTEFLAHVVESRLPINRFTSATLRKFYIRRLSSCNEFENHR